MVLILIHNLLVILKLKVAKEENLLKSILYLCFLKSDRYWNLFMNLQIHEKSRKYKNCDTLICDTMYA